ncbi:hypothetical protein [Vineibacter terrae]|uniref:hypothetical protein n=1 Tax=Vineibacter terrae TaxID=2586908 RepID=UPI002E34595B|nr:hypothetical protein [Vineibacter terrae]HEX2885685.1 hypothetical protein [Vineibacter terrae]
MIEQHSPLSADDVAFTRPLAIRGRNGAVVLHTVRQTIDWIDGKDRLRVRPGIREAAWRLHDARHVHSQEEADDASDRLGYELAALGMLKR